MKTSEFIKAFNKVGKPHGLVAYEETFMTTGVAVAYFGQGVYDNPPVVARLTKGDDNWTFFGEETFIFNTEALKVMVEFAETPEEEREKPERYVILNCKPQPGYWEVFRIGDDNQFLVCYGTTSRESLDELAYTMDELKQEKERWLPEAWQEAVDSMLVPIDEALAVDVKPGGIEGRIATRV
ncbi:hypothetical protein lacNasYZ03_11470 [Lactobacillus nasalidis]|uniref:DUF4304 domain-containing protein n=1 Tax=Lactobacillus nasalidis TaxID=2797258 RepID=A0ABQ3W4K4_9LACO|nr:hypothetical protein [Lactobacillus nasalidis]GHV97871.1 hypothetical protein lacNasYZ01_10530 [Lactobacillus nasalidis]GHW00101.1 hypothetical protein lacNasYZ02_15300 [Lactobacillus nasalidis]GHW01460.1 hypothetical protein lacNasYZ03_11470 [Lactobacillus nasalidis]